MTRGTYVGKARPSFAKALAAVLAAAACAGALSACAGGAETAETAADGSEGAEAGASEDVEYASFQEVADAFSVDALDLEYTDRDQDASYDEAMATRIELSGSGATVTGEGASVAGSDITIEAEGTYIVAGSLDDGQLAIDVADDAKVQVVLAGATIHNEDGPAIYVKQADKCFVTLAEGTENALSDGAAYTLEDGSDEPYATLFSRADLTLNGTGSLSVDAAYRHGICSKDDLVICGGTYTVGAVEDGLRGRDCVKVLSGDITVTAGGDGVKSNKDDDPERGFVTIDGGTLDVTAGDDGIQAVTYLRVSGGDLRIEASDDALHSNLEGALLGGTVAVDVGDDAFHAETVLNVDAGSFNASSCYEGLEAEKIYMNGGDVNVVASDDALNASAADLSGEDSSTTTDAATVDAADDGVPSDDGAATAEGAGEPPRDASGGQASTPPDGFGGGDFDPNEAQAGGGAPDGAFAEGMNEDGTMQPGATMGDEDCLIQINGGTVVLDSQGDGIDSNGSVEITGGTVLVNGPSNGADGAFDYDLSATVSGGTVLMVGAVGMAQNFTGGTQPFAFAQASGGEGDTIQVLSEDGAVLAELTATKGFGAVLASSPQFAEGGTYSLVVGDSTTELTASTTASGGFGGLGAGGGPMGAGQPGQPNGGQ